MKKLALHVLAGAALLSGPAYASNIQVDEDLIQGVNRHVLMIDSENTVSNSIGRQKHATLIVRCKAGRADFYLWTPTFNGLRNSRVAVRWSAEDISNQYWNQGKGGKSFFSKTPKKFLDLTTQRDQLILGWHPYSTTQVAAKFDLAKHRSDLLKMKEVCR